MLGHAPTIRRGKAHRVPYLTIGRFPCLDVVVDGVEKAQFRYRSWSSSLVRCLKAPPE